MPGCACWRAVALTASRRWWGIHGGRCGRHFSTKIRRNPGNERQGFMPRLLRLFRARQRAGFSSLQHHLSFILSAVHSSPAATRQHPLCNPPRAALGRRFSCRSGFGVSSIIGSERMSRMSKVPSLALAEAAQGLRKNARWILILVAACATNAHAETRSWTLPTAEMPDLAGPDRKRRVGKEC